MRAIQKQLKLISQQLRSLGEQPAAASLDALSDGLLQSQIRVAVFGEFSRGKSTLINAILGREVLRSGRVPTTGQIARVAFGKKESIRVHFHDGHATEFSLEAIGDFSIGGQGVARDDVAWIDVIVNAPLLKSGIVLVDTPGTNDDATQTSRARSALSQADLVLFILDATKLLSEQEKQLAAEWLACSLDKPVVPVVNRINLVDARDRAELNQRLDAWCSANLRPFFPAAWYAVNAKGDLDHATARMPAPDDDFRSLRQALSDCTGNLREQIQSRSRRGQIRYELHEVAIRNDEARNRLQEDSARLEAERLALKKILRAHLSRIDATSQERRDAVIGRVQRALDDALSKLLTETLAGKTREVIEAQGANWYQQSMLRAIRAQEWEARQTLLRFTSDDLAHPEPLTVAEGITLDNRIIAEAGGLPSFFTRSVGMGVGIGAAIGTFMAPGVGTAVGGFIGGWIARNMDQQDSSPAAHYAPQIKARWNEDAQRVLQMFHKQFDARVARMRKQLKERAASLTQVSPSSELQSRDELAGSIDRCRELLPH